MVWRKHPELSAYDEGAMEADNWIAFLEEEGEWGGLSAQENIMESGQSSYTFMQEKKANGTLTKEHEELLQGFLSRFL